MSTLREDFEVWYRVEMADDPNGPGALCEWLAYQAATERAAKLAEAEAVEELGPGDRGYNFAIKHCAAAIRGTGSKEP